MILLIFIIGLLFTGICLFIGFGSGNFGLAYLGMFAMLLLGLFIMSDGIQMENGMAETPLGSHNFVTVYEDHTTANDTIIALIANTFFYLPFAGILLTTYIALRQ